jgi:methionyl-tRNA formyltransferase
MGNLKVGIIMIDEPFYSEEFILKMIETYEVEFVILHTDFISLKRIIKTFFIYRLKNFIFTVFSVLRNNIYGGQINNILKNHKIKTMKTGDVNSNEVASFILDKDVDVLISFNCPQKIKSKLLNLPSKFPINIHLGYLPAYRGVFPIFHAFINEEKFVGTTIHVMNENFDDGKILVQEKVEIVESDNMLTLYEKTFSLIPRLTIDALNGILNNNIELKSNDPQYGSYHSFPTFKEVIKYRKMTSKKVKK